MSNYQELSADGELTESQLKKVDQLSKKDIELIDGLLVSSASFRWKKVANIVGSVMCHIDDDYPESILNELQDLFFSMRVRTLVENNVLESCGDLSRMRYSRVRLKESEKNAEKSKPGRVGRLFCPPFSRDQWVSQLDIKFYNQKFNQSSWLFCCCNLLRKHVVAITRK